MGIQTASYSRLALRNGGHPTAESWPLTRRKLGRVKSGIKLLVEGAGMCSRNLPKEASSGEAQFPDYASKINRIDSARCKCLLEQGGPILSFLPGEETCKRIPLALRGEYPSRHRMVRRAP